MVQAGQSDPYAALEASLQEEYPESLKLDETNPTVIGQFVRLSWGPSNYSEGLVPIAVLRLKDGKLVSIWLTQSALRNQFTRARPQPGDYVGIAFLGEEHSKSTGRDYKKYRVEKFGETGDQVDWDRLDPGGDVIAEAEDPVAPQWTPQDFPKPSPEADVPRGTSPNQAFYGMPSGIAQGIEEVRRQLSATDVVSTNDPTQPETAGHSSAPAPQVVPSYGDVIRQALTDRVILPSVVVEAAELVGLWEASAGGVLAKGTPEQLKEVAEKLGLV